MVRHRKLNRPGRAIGSGHGGASLGKVGELPSRTRRRPPIPAAACQGRQLARRRLADDRASPGGSQVVSAAFPSPRRAIIPRPRSAAGRPAGPRHSARKSSSASAVSCAPAAPPPTQRHGGRVVPPRGGRQPPGARGTAPSESSPRAYQGAGDTASAVAGVEAGRLPRNSDRRRRRRRGLAKSSPVDPRRRPIGDRPALAARPPAAASIASRTSVSLTSAGKGGSTARGVDHHQAPAAPATASTISGGAGRAARGPETRGPGAASIPFRGPPPWRPTMRSAAPPGTLPRTAVRPGYLDESTESLCRGRKGPGELLDR